MPKTRTNYAAGVRISWSMYNDNTWRKSNRFGGYALIITGIITIMESVLVSNSFVASMIMVGLLILATIVIVIYAHRVYIQEIEAEGARES